MFEANLEATQQSARFFFSSEGELLQGLKISNVIPTGYVETKNKNGNMFFFCGQLEKHNHGPQKGRKNDEGSYFNQKLHQDIIDGVYGELVGRSHYDPDDSGIVDRVRYFYEVKPNDYSKELFK